MSTIVLINTGIPGLVLAALLGEAAGPALANTLKTYTRDLFLLLLVSLYFEWARSREQVHLLKDTYAQVSQINNALRRATPEAVRGLAIRATTPHELVEAGIARYISNAPDLKSIATKVLSTRVPYHDVTIELHIEDVTDDRVVALSRAIFNAHPRHVLYGITKQADHAAALSSSYPELLESYGFPGVDFDTINSGTELPAIRLYSRRESDNRFSELRLRRVSVHDDPNLFARLPDGLTPDQVTFLRPAESVSLDEPLRFRSDVRWSFDPRVRYLYWCADRPTYVRHLSFDVRRLASAGLDMHVVPFMGDMADLLIDVDKSHVTIRPNAWLLEGHGAIVLW